MIYLYSDPGLAYSMNRYLSGVIQGLENNGVDYKVVRPKRSGGLIVKYLIYPLKTLVNRNNGTHLILSERYAYLLWFMRKSDSRVICHDLHTLYPEARVSSIHYRIYRFMLRSMRRAEKIVCISNHTRQDLLRFDPSTNEENVVVVPNGVEDFWTRPAQEVKQEPWNGLFDQYKVLLSVGTDAWYKQNDWSLKALSLLKEDYHLIRIGNFNESNKRLINQLKIADRITQLSDIDDIDLKYCYTHAHALLFPSMSEGFGWPALEAALSNCPVITTKGGAIKEVLDWIQYAC